MKTIKSLVKPFILVVLATCFSCNRADTPEDILSRHPRILLIEGEEEIIKKSVEANLIWKEMHETILGESDAIISLPPVERELTGRRLLGKSREALRRIFYLSYSYRMNGNEKYVERAEKEMLAAAGFSDWNPSHFLDVGEMTMAMAIGYDWLYHELSPLSREIIREAILKKGLEASLDPDYNWFLNTEHNWNQVCNAGMTYGAIAVYEYYPELASEIIDRAYNTIILAKADYEPDPAVVRWQRLTGADVAITGNNSATLALDGRTLDLRVDSPRNVKVTTWSAQPGTEWDVANPGTMLVGFEVTVPANSRETLDVKFIPGSSDSDAGFDRILGDW